MLWRRLLPLMNLAAACSDGTSADTRPTFSVVPASQWSGGTVNVRSTAFRGANFPAMYAAGSLLPVSRIDNTTRAVRLPVMASGDLVISRTAAGRDTVGGVQLYGLHAPRKRSGSVRHD
jgi:hypothetical protein